MKNMPKKPAQSGSANVPNIKTNSNPIPRDLQERVRDKIITARVGLLLTQPFFGKICARLVLEPADSWCTTAATDGKHFYYNHEFIDMLKPGEVQFLVGHEVLHAVYDHMGRRGDRDPQLYNVAADYVVNQDLVDQRVGTLITTVPALLDKKYSGWSSEEVYDDLFKNAKKIDIQQLVNQLLDEHLDGTEDGDGDSNGAGKQGAGGAGRPQLTEDEKRAIRDDLMGAVIAAAQQSAGNLPAGIKRLVGDLTEPKMDWRQLIRASVESTVINDYTWLKPSRRSWHMDAILPGTEMDQMINVAVALDMSGSIGPEEAREMLSEVDGIMKQFPNYRMQVWCFDTQVYNDEVFTSDDGRDIREYEVKGGGGTSFDVNWEYMKERDIRPDVFLMFTDGYTGDGWGEESYCETIFVIHGGFNGKAPHGITVPYK